MRRNGGVLRDYQVEALTRFHTSQSDRSAIHAISLPTGAGKTAACVAVAESFLEERSQKGCVLWLAPSWFLLEQAASAVATWSPEYTLECRRIGGDRSLLRHLPTSEDGRFFFTTLHTWRERRRSALSCARPHENLLVVIDECHWGANKPILSDLLKAHLGTSCVLGLSATLKTFQHYPLNALTHRTYADLAGRYLAVPTIIDLFSNQSWSASLSRGEFTAQSLRKLATNSSRNHLIVDHVLQGLRVGTYKTVLVFACDVAHADSLERLFSRRGASVRCIHSHQKPQHVQRAVREFREGHLDILVNVSMLGQGFDLPEVNAL